MFAKLTQWLADQFIVASHEKIQAAFLRLTDKEQQLLSLRLGLLDDYRRTLEETGMILEMSREDVRQFEVKTIKKFKQFCLA